MHQVDGRSTKSAASQSGSIAALEAPGDFNEGVQLRGAVMEEIARTFVALQHVLPKLREISGPEGARPEYHSLNFANNVIGALILTLAQLRPVGRQILGIHRTE